MSEYTYSLWHHFLSADVYHETFILPDDDIITQRLQKGQSLSEQQRLAKLHRYRCEVTGLRSAYQHVLKVINSDQPHTDVYEQGTASQTEWTVQTHTTDRL